MEDISSELKVPPTCANYALQQVARDNTGVPSNYQTDKAKLLYGRLCKVCSQRGAG